jgi:carbamoyltransferase
MTDGQLIGIIQEERFTKRKNQVALPLCAAQALVESHLGGDRSKIDQVVFGGRWDSPYWVALDHYSDFSVADQVQEMHELWHPYFYGEGLDPDAYWRNEIKSGKHLNPDHNLDFSFLDQLEGNEAKRHFNDVERTRAVREWIGTDTPCKMIDHHKAHAYWALYGAPLPSSLDDVLVVTADSMGDTSNWSVAIPGADGALEVLDHGLDHDVARVYKFVTLILGMKPNEHEYKVMGLSSYSRSRPHIAAVEAVLFEALDFRDGKFVNERPLKDRYFDLKDRLEGHRFDNISAGLQNWSSQITQAWICHWIKKTGRSAVSFSGGLSMNIKANGDILGMPELTSLSVPASGGDESLSAGACYAFGAENGTPITPLSQACLGEPAAMAANWTTIVSQAGAEPGDFDERHGTSTEDLARLLAAGAIIARCVGRSEFGARALGNRSILANPSDANTIKVINDAIKARDFWMPFTPSILAEHADAYLVNPKHAVSPFMTIGFETRVERRSEIIGALHPADFSARPQFVSHDHHPEYWDLIDSFRKLTGIPALLNTSLNLHGEPMNYSTEDAIRTLALSGLDFLILPDDVLIFRRRVQSVLDQALELEFSSQ